MLKKITFSIIITVRNAEDDLPSLFESLGNLNYPDEQFEIIFVNDQSTDSSKILIDKFIETNSNTKIFDSFGKKYPGRSGALAIGVNHSRFDHIMIIPSNGEPHQEWLNAFAVKFNDGYDLIFGLTPFKQSDKFINKLSRFDNLRSQLLASKLIKLGLPVLLNYDNFGFRKEKFEITAGDSKEIDRLIGKQLLLPVAIKNKFNIDAIEPPNSVVRLNTHSTWSRLIDYKLRSLTHSSLGTNQRIVIWAWYIINFLLILSPVLMIINLAFFFLFLFKLLLDLIITQKNQYKFTYKFSEIEIIYLQVVDDLLILPVIFKGLFKK